MSDSLEQHGELDNPTSVASIKRHVPWIFRLGSNREMRLVLDHLQEHETVLSVTTGRYAGGRGLITLTDFRLIVTFDGYVRSSSEGFPLEHVTSIEWNKQFIKGKITVYVAGNEAIVENVYYGGRDLVLEARTVMRKVKQQVEEKRQYQQHQNMGGGGYQGQPPPSSGSATGLAPQASQQQAQYYQEPPQHRDLPNLSPPPAPSPPVAQEQAPTNSPPQFSLPPMPTPDDSPATSNAPSVDTKAKLELLDTQMENGELRLSEYQEHRRRLLGE